MCRLQGIAVCWKADVVYYIPLNPPAPGVLKSVAGMMSNKRMKKITYDLKTQMLALLAGMLENVIKWKSYIKLLNFNLYCTNCIVLYCTVLYCTVLYCTVLYCAVPYCTVLCCTVSSRLVSSRVVLCYIALHCIALSCLPVCNMDQVSLVEAHIATCSAGHTSTKQCLILCTDTDMHKPASDVLRSGTTLFR